ncbi:MAG TPA: cystathionine beta-synthase [Lentisphaeria bacterium]|nr:MAG: cystathionine beta-synthase [Lentisphaerae bacterium GWF2_38_69]HBM17305.1 cystathionine beta-synthase [Lentisphaeria bacterium]
MKYYNSVLEKIGHTPLIKLNKISDGLKVNIFAKVEYFNPGGSSKDRIALTMIEDAEKKGLLREGSTIIEATAGNTGAGLALVAARKGYRCVFVMPDKMSSEKINLLKGYGAEVVITPTSVPPDSPMSYNGVADRLAREIPNSFRPGQFTNLKNPEAHYLTTGPEIWEDLEGKVDAFVSGMGTGGTISGTGKYLKEKNPNIKIVGADPEGSILSGDFPKSYKVEGIGEDFIPVTFDRQIVDDMVRVSDTESFITARRLAREEGLLVGGSSGTAMAAALKYSQRLSGGENIVVLLPDTGRNYLTKLYSDEWMIEHGFMHELQKKVSVGELLKEKSFSSMLISIDSSESAARASRIMTENNISQMPVLKDGAVIGSINEGTLIKLLHDGINLNEKSVFNVMGTSLPQLDEGVDVAELYRLLMAGHGGVVITRSGGAIGFLSKIDLVSFWTK